MSRPSLRRFVRIEALGALAADPRLSSIVCDLVAAALVTAALVVAMRATHGLLWPFDPDHWRDIAQAQTVRDGHPLADQYYLGEWVWYNPLLAWTLAAGSLLTGVSVTLFHVQTGPYLNLLGPVAFYLLARRLAGPPAALAGLTLYLFFLSGPEPFPLYATYSPWLFAANFAQGLFFVSVLALLWARDRPTVMRTLASGALVGATFLAHSAPGVLLAAIACALFVADWRALARIGGMALLVASPFLVTVVVHYHFRVLNPAPFVWEYTPVMRDHLPQTLWDNWLLIGAAMIGLVVAPRRALTVWLVTSAALMIYSVVPLPRLLPAFHFWLYTTAALELLAGCTIAWLCRRPLIVAGLVGAAVIWQWPSYANRSDLSLGRREALRRNPNFAPASEFLHRTLRSNDIVLGTYGAANLIIGPSGRKTVASIPMLSNPYVAIEPRSTDRDRMLVAIDHADVATFASLAAAYHVAAVVSVGGRECTAASIMLTPVWRSGDVCVSTIPW